MTANREIVVVCRNIDPSLRRVLSLFLIEIAPLTFCGKLSRQVQDKLWEELQRDFPQYEITMLDFTSLNENGFNIRENIQMMNRNTLEYDGITLGTRRIPEKMVWETVLGKTIPFEYPLIRHLIDTAAFAYNILKYILSEQQINMLQHDLQIENKEKLYKIILFVSGMHDIGKAHPEWQHNTLHLTNDHPSLNKILEIPEEINKEAERWRHDINSGVFFTVNSHIKNSNIQLSKFLSELTATHHGDFDLYSKIKQHQNYPLNEKWITVQKNIEKCMMEIFGIDDEITSNFHAPAMMITSQLMISGIIILADWLASRSDFMKDTTEQKDYQTYFEVTKNTAKEHIEKLGLKKPEWKQNLTWAKVFPHISQPNNLQESFIKQQDIFHTNGLTLINAPMGIGKTETSLYLASINGSITNNAGIWVTLPTQATANALFERGTEIHDKIFNSQENSVALLHGNATLNEAMENIKHKSKRVFTEETLNNFENMDDPQENIQSSFDNTNNPSTIFVSDFLVEQKTGGMSSIVISTIDQLINVTTPLKHNMLRWLAITGKTLILDEIHDFDAYTFSLIKKFVRWAGFLNINIILMSASLSENSQKELIKEYAGKKRNIDDVIPKNGIPSPSWVHIKNKENNELEVYKSENIIAQEYCPYIINLQETESPLQTINEIIKNNEKANTLVVAHTVNQAISFYRTIKENYSGDVFLLHSRMTELQKQRILHKILNYSGKPSANNQRIPHILVATQVVQQSMDIDYDILVTILPPLPEFLQRVGRVYRHEQGNRRVKKYINNPQIYVLIDKEINSFIEDTRNDMPIDSPTPYDEWEIVLTLLTLKEYIKNSNKQNIKKDIAQLFALYYSLEDQYKNLPKYSGYYRSFKDTNLLKEDKGTVKSINSPEDYNRSMASLKLTKSFTEKSRLAAKTRLISETEQIVFIKKIKDDFYIVTDIDKNHKVLFQKIPLDLFMLRKMIGLSSFTVSKYSVYEKFLKDSVQEISVDIVGRTQDYVKFVNFDEVCDIVFDHNEGLSFTEIPSSNRLWI